MSTQPTTPDIAGQVLGTVAEPVIDTTPSLEVQASVSEPTSWLDNIPGSEASYEDHKDYFSKIGVPESADQYEWTAPEGFDETLMPPKEILDKYAEIAHQFKIPSEALKALFNATLENTTGDFTKAQEAHALEQASRNDQLTQLWGEAVADKANSASKALETFASKEQREFFQQNADMYNHPVFLDMLAKIGESLSGSTQPGAKSTSVKGFAVTPREAAANRIKEIQNNPEYKQIQFDPNHPNFKTINAELNSLYAQAFE